MPNMTAGYRRYFSGLKKADCLLVAKTRNPDFVRLIVEPPVPRRRPDLTAFIHKPLEVSSLQYLRVGPRWGTCICMLALQNCALLGYLYLCAGLTELCAVGVLVFVCWPYRIVRCWGTCICVLALQNCALLGYLYLCAGLTELCAATKFWFALRVLLRITTALCLNCLNWWACSDDTQCGFCVVWLMGHTLNK
jgi:hypothetical protein